jgi:Ca-activated chloride channel family protein
VSIDPNDPRLTAYALGELDEAQRAAIEVDLQNSPDTRAAVDKIRAVAAQLTDELAAEPCPELETQQKLRIANRASGVEGRKQPPVRWWIVSTAVAACILVAVSVSLWLPKYAGVPGLSLGRRSTEPIGAAPPRAIAVDDASRAIRSRGDVKATEQISRQIDERLRSLGYVSAGSEVGGVKVYTDFGHNGVSYGYQIPHPSPDMRQPVGGISYTSAEELRALLQALSFASGEPPEQCGNTEAYDQIVENPFLDARQNPLSTFSIDVDTASYANIRRFLNAGQLPPKGAVRIEEMINYFSYDWPPPEGDEPFNVYAEVAGCPWNPDHRLVLFGLKGMEIEQEQRPPSNLVFLLDVSGSMQPDNKLPLLKQAMQMLVQELDDDDTVAIVVYAGQSGLVLPPTICNSLGKREILDSLHSLQASGSTNGGAGMQLAYDMAEEVFIEGGTNRVIWATDGDFNVGITDRSALVQMIQARARRGVFLTVLGFGTGNLKDSTLEMLADKGNGNYAYVDNLSEGYRVLVEQIHGTLVTIAKDVKLQIEFNPAEVAAYRLIGYENRVLAAEDFNDDTKDAGEIGAGHTVTALYEVVPVGQPAPHGLVDPLKYQTRDEPPAPADAFAGEMLTVKLRYKDPDGDVSRLQEFVVTDDETDFANASQDFQFAAAVAGFGLLLRDSQYKGDLTYDAVAEIAKANLGEDASGYRAEFLNLVRTARRLGDP